MPKPPIYQQILEAFSDRVGRIFTTAEIKRDLAERFGTEPASVIPSDYCYNRTNKGGQPPTRRIFVQVTRGEYKVLGEGARYSGWVLHRAKGSDAEVIVGQWIDGVYHALEPKDLPSAAPEATPAEPATAAPTPAGTTRRTAPPEPLEVRRLRSLTREQIQRLYEDYCELLELEVQVFGVKPTEVRHLIGRIGEFKAALKLGGALAHRTNQAGFDIIAAGRTVSVKTTAQSTGFVSVNISTMDLADDLLVLQYRSGEFREVFHGLMTTAATVGREYQGRLEIDLGKLRRLRAPRR